MKTMPHALRFGSMLAVVAALTLPVCARAQDWAKTALDKSPRHHDYVDITHDGRKVTTFIVYPEVKDKAPVVVLIHEIFGLSDWFKLQADELAAKGFIVVAPDLLSGIGPNGGGTDALFATTGTTDLVTKAVSALPPEQVLADLDAVSDYGKKLPSANGKLTVAGFCWGGGKSFAFATHRADLIAAFVFYGTPPPASAMAAINAPIYGFYGEMDARVDATIPQAQTDMKAAGKFYDPVIYKGAGHGFMRAGQAPPPAADATPQAVEMYAANKKAWEEGFARMVAELKKTTGPGAKGVKMSNAVTQRKPRAVKAATQVECHDGMTGM
jgi:carboxymethylenebutenolidase